MKAHLICDPYQYSQCCEYVFGLFGGKFYALIN